MHVIFPDTGPYKHAVCVETIAALPGLQAVSSRTFSCLRNLKLDASWCNSLYEERENEYIHMAIFKEAYLNASPVARFTFIDQIKLYAVHFGART
mmetsp:Transcript_15029/g.7316  ORF Transcript_15029/g.7316 Transcript_15029/m.7316 type:complete len:95 (-) Transcript_15029:307-591(-)